MSEDVPFDTSTSTTSPSDARPGKPPRRPAPPSQPSRSSSSSSSPDRDHRLALMQTGGRVVHVWDHDIASVKEVSTQKHGACLLAEVRGGGELWLLDDRANRSALSLRRP